MYVSNILRLAYSGFRVFLSIELLPPLFWCSNSRAGGGSLSLEYEWTDILLESAPSGWFWQIVLPWAVTAERVVHFLIHCNNFTVSCTINNHCDWVSVSVCSAFTDKYGSAPTSLEVSFTAVSSVSPHFSCCQNRTCYLRKKKNPISFDFAGQRLMSQMFRQNSWIHTLIMRKYDMMWWNYIYYVLMLCKHTLLSAISFMWAQVYYSLHIYLSCKTALYSSVLHISVVFFCS